jgi:transketolase
MFASANKIDNIICTIDYNQKQIDGDLKEVLDLGDIPQKFKSFNWHVIKLLDGNNLKKVEEALISAKKLTGNGKPVAIIMSTIMGNGVDYMMGTHKWHGVAPNNEELKIALDQNPETLKDY